MSGSGADCVEVRLIWSEGFSLILSHFTANNNNTELNTTVINLYKDFAVLGVP